VVSLRRSNGHVVDPASDPGLEDGDTLVLSGRPDTLALAEEMLLKG
jgi:monovalent cation:H+ antiporter-2, CPA2 family